jgi:hypothetical protein
MTAQDGLERRHRRLLAAYPWRHRQVYEEEMVGLLLAEAEPSQRRPRPAESADLLMSAVAVRLRSGFDGLRDDDWRPAAYAVQVFGALFLLAVAFRRVALDATALVVLRHQAPGFFAEAWLYTAGWALVLAATLLQWRRSAAALATMAAAMATIVLLVTYGFAGFMYSSQQFPQPILLAPVQWMVLLVAPVLAFVLAAVAVQAYERQLQLIALGRDAERRAHRDPAGRAYRAGRIRVHGTSSKPTTPMSVGTLSPWSSTHSMAPIVIMLFVTKTASGRSWAASREAMAVRPPSWRKSAYRTRLSSYGRPAFSSARR